MKKESIESILKDYYKGTENTIAGQHYIKDMIDKKIVRFEVKFEVEGGEVFQMDFTEGEWRGTAGTNGTYLADRVIKFLQGNK